MARQWWVACEHWAEAGSFATEEKAQARAANLDKVATCGQPHFYWESPTPPTSTGRWTIAIPEGAKRA